MLVRGRKAQGARVRGVLPDYEPQVSSVGEKMRDGQLAALQPGANGIILGAELARSLGVAVGDRLAVITPQPYDLAGAGPASLLPGLKRFTVVGVFAAGMSEFDSGLALMRLEDALALFKRDRPAGLRLKNRRCHGGAPDQPGGLRRCSRGLAQPARSWTGPSGTPICSRP